MSELWWWLARFTRHKRELIVPHRDDDWGCPSRLTVEVENGTIEIRMTTGNKAVISILEHENG